ncbi:MAG: Ig-like domain-containing protein, partial [Clostridia bacterium]|nr:Ig-like domain-containing protein [Clostridia bacterium]
DAAIECDVQPANASDPRLLYEAEPEGVVEVDGKGVLRALAEGEATVTVRARDGGLTDALSVTVNPAPRRWRALLVGEQNYASTVASVRTGSVNSVAGLRSMLEGLTLSGAKPRVGTLLDASRDGVLAAIAETFAGAGERDVSLFYITCHGSYSGGMTFLKMYDGSVLSAAELAEALRNIRGEVFAIIDCCGSGGVLARASETEDILKGIDAVFGGVLGPPALEGSRFRVLASAALEQDSYRISFSDAAAESGMATVFARALCEAGGWSLDRSARTAPRADADYDGAVTLNELYTYTARRVLWYLRLAGGTDARAQSVQVWPEDDGTVVFER